MNFKISPNLGLGFAELLFLQSSLSKELLLNQFIESYGIVRRSEAFDELKITQGIGNTISINTGVLIDSDLQTVEIPLLQNHIEISEDPATRYIVIKYEKNTIEKGRVQIQEDGTLTVELNDEASEVDFTKKLRGLGPITSKIKFPNSVNNVGEYFVRDVINSQALLLNIGRGVLIPETNLQWQVVGSFTQGSSIDEADKYPFENDSYSIEVRTSSDIIEGKEFILASVTYINSQLSITDTRDNHKFMLNRYIYND